MKSCSLILSNGTLSCLSNTIYQIVRMTKEPDAMLCIRIMKKLLFLQIVISQIACSSEQVYNVHKYHEHVNHAELAISSMAFSEAVISYKVAFNHIPKPFGNDVYNAALCSHLANDADNRNKYLQLLVDNSDDYGMIKATFIDKYALGSIWATLIEQKEIDYNVELRKEFNKIEERDQLFRPMYESHWDTIEANRLINLNRILDVSDSSGFPSHIELGYRENLRGQDHDIVLHHTAQRRSTDKVVYDMKSILREAVDEGIFDPEQAIFYLQMQNDEDKRVFVEYSTWQYRHHELPDSLNSKIWVRNFTDEELTSVNETRTAWYADQIEDIDIKSSFLSSSDLPFIFTSVRRSIANLSDDYDYEEALDQYHKIKYYRNLEEL